MFAFSQQELADDVFRWLTTPRLSSYSMDEEVGLLPPNMYIVHAGGRSEDVYLAKIEWEDLLDTALMNHLNICLIDQMKHFYGHAEEDCILLNSSILVDVGQAVHLLPTSSIRGHLQKLWHAHE
jgi:hypothetical protein